MLILNPINMEYIMAKRKSPKAGKKPAKKPQKTRAKKEPQKPKKIPKLAERHVWLVRLIVCLPLVLIAVFIYVLGWKLGYWDMLALWPLLLGALVLGFMGAHAFVVLLNDKIREKALK